MPDSLQHVPGKNAGHVMFYGLTTCGWCAKTKKLLDDLGVEYYFKYVDQLKDQEREDALVEISKWNPNTSFPTLIIDDQGGA